MDPPKNKAVDEALVLFSDFILGLTDMSLKEEAEESMQIIIMEALKLDLPMDIDLTEDEDGNIIIGAGPPVHRTETSYKPNYHQIKVTLRLNDE